MALAKDVSRPVERYAQSEDLELQGSRANDRILEPSLGEI